MVRKSETKRVWVAPELKKVDVEQITANVSSTPSSSDGHAGKS
jgi:hypothetical protein